MRLLYILDTPYAFNNGCWFYRNHIPAEALKRRGHNVHFLALNSGRGIPDEMMTFPDTVVFSRTYPVDPLVTMRKFKKLGKRCIYETDDDLWTVNPDNPSVAISTEKRRQYEHLMDECDAVTTTTSELAKKLRKFNKNVFICPNAIDYSLMKHKDIKMPKERLRLGYSGAASHWRDLELVTEVLVNIQKKYDVEFVLQGMCGCPLEVEIWQYKQVLTYGLRPEKKLFLEQAVKWYQGMKNVRFFHVPFYPPVMFPTLLSSLNIDIGIAPLQDNEFNHSKSCVKFYEYASIGAVTLASKVLPYKKEVGYCAKNNVKDWVAKLERLITDKDFREKLRDKQAKWVKENRDINKVVEKWEDAFDPKKV